MTAILRKLHEWRFELTALILSGWGMWLRYLRLLNRDLWLDERFSLSCITGSIKPLLWKLAPNGERSCFPGYYYLTWPFVQIFKTNKWGINCPHILITALGFYFFYLLCRRYLKSMVAFVFAFLLFVYNDSLIFHAFEFRPYAALSTIAISTLFFSERLMDGAYKSWWKKTSLFFALILFTIYHPYGLLMIVLVFSYLLSRNRSLFQTDEWNNFLKFGAIFLCVAVPIFSWYASGTAGPNADASGMNTINEFEFIANPFVNGIQFARDIVGNLLGITTWWKFILFAGLIMALFVRPSQRNSYLVFGSIFVVIPIELILLSDLYKDYWFIQRQFIWTMPYFTLLIACAWEGLLSDLVCFRGGWTRYFLQAPFHIKTTIRDD
jgi:hypothetical protein